MVQMRFDITLKNKEKTYRFIILFLLSSCGNFVYLLFDEQLWKKGYPVCNYVLPGYRC